MTKPTAPTPIAHTPIAPGYTSAPHGFFAASNISNKGHGCDAWHKTHEDSNHTWGNYGE